jgi:hypothetical protein
MRSGTALRSANVGAGRRAATGEMRSGTALRSANVGAGRRAATGSAIGRCVWKLDLIETSFAIQ